jgi:hypothetical protein
MISREARSANMADGTLVKKFYHNSRLPKEKTGERRFGAGPSFAIPTSTRKRLRMPQKRFPKSRRTVLESAASTSSDVSSRLFRSPKAWASRAIFGNGRICCESSFSIRRKGLSEPMQKGMSMRVVPCNTCVGATLRVRFDHLKVEPLADRNGVISLGHRNVDDGFS